MLSRITRALPFPRLARAGRFILRALRPGRGGSTGPQSFIDSLPDAVAPEFATMQFGGRAMMKLLSDFQFQTVLDVGCGAGEQAAAFVRHGKQVTALDFGNSPYFQRRDPEVRSIVGNFNTYPFEEPFDCVWASHVLEHQLDAQGFLAKIHAVTREDGVVAITVPPMKQQIVGGHVSLWNGGLLLYRLVLAGFDCCDASVLRYGYNISVIVKKRTIELPPMCFDMGDIRSIRRYLPQQLQFGSSELDDSFNGDIERLNW